MAAMTTLRIIGLDGEMSGADLERGHRLIQIGVAVDTAPDGSALPEPDLFCSLIGWDEADMVWDERAAQVHNIPKEAVLAAPRAAEVDALLGQWLTGHGLTRESRGGSIMCGFNVGAFDAPFVRDTLPQSCVMFSRRYADLNPVTMLLASAKNVLGGMTNDRGWKRWGKRAGRELVASVGRVEAEHDAGTDALLAIGAWRAYEDLVAGLDRDAATTRARERALRKAAALAG